MTQPSDYQRSRGEQTADLMQAETAGMHDRADWTPEAVQEAIQPPAPEWQTLTHREAVGLLTRQEAVTYLEKAAGNLPGPDKAALERLHSATAPLDTGDLMAARDALAKAAGTNANGEADEPVAQRLMRESQRLILQHSNLSETYQTGIERLAANTDTDRDRQGTEEGFHKFMESRLARAIDAGWKLPEALQTLHDEAMAITAPADTRLAAWTAVYDGPAPREVNWLVRETPNFSNTSDSGEYLMDAMKSNRVGQPGHPTVDEFATAIIDTVIDRDLAAEWRIGPTAYQKIPRNPHPGVRFDESASHAKATYAWLINDALHPDGLGTAAWNGNAEELTATAQEKATRLKGMEHVLTSLTVEGWNNADNRVDPQGYAPAIRWSEGRHQTWERVMRLTDNGDDLDTLNREASKAQEYLEGRLATPGAGWLDAEDHNSPTALLVQEAIATLYEIKLEVYQATLEQANAAEETVGLGQALDRMEELYREQGHPNGDIEDWMERHTLASKETPEETDARENYIQNKLQSAVARLAHVDFNISAIHALRERNRAQTAPQDQPR